MILNLKLLDSHARSMKTKKMNKNSRNFHPVVIRFVEKKKKVINQMKLYFCFSFSVFTHLDYLILCNIQIKSIPTAIKSRNQ